MRQHTRQNIIFLLVIAILVIIITGCNGAGSFGPLGQTSQDDIQVKIELGQPIQLNQPVSVTITVETDEDIPGMEVFIVTSDPDIRILDGQGYWTFDAIAHQPRTFTTTIEFTKEGNFDVIAYAKDTRIAKVVGDSVDLRITKEGATLNPPDVGAVEMAEKEGQVISGTLTADTTPSPTPYPTPIPQTQISVGDLNLTIPDDNSWITLPLSVTDIPSEAVVSGVSIKFLIDHPQGEDLTVELVGPDNSTAIRLWEREIAGADDLYEGLLYRSLLDLTLFNGLPVAGEWRLRVRDEMPGNIGAIESVTLAVSYELPPTAPVQPMEEKSPVETPQSVPPVEPPPEPPPDDSENSSGAIQPPARDSPSMLAQADLETQGTWTTITTQGFEGVFPGNGWSAIDLTGTGYQRFWDDDDYRPHTGSWAAWPANGGSNAIYPVPGNDNYPNDMDTRMIYGPFDLSDTTKARVSFYLWRELETNYDYLTLEISPDGNTFQQIFRWDGTEDWRKWTVYLNSFTGDSSVWLSWRFVSDYSITRDGPWVDDIVIEKERPGQVTARGRFYYYDRQNNIKPAAYTPVYLYDSDPLGTDDYLGADTTDVNGYWEIGPVTNQDDPGDLTLDLYAKWILNTTRRTVTRHDGTVYSWFSGTQVDVSDGTIDFGNYFVPDGSDNEKAMWIFQDMRQAWVFPSPNDPGSATVRWQKNGTGLFPCYGNSCYWPYPSVNGVFIFDDHAISPDIVIHEVGHAYMDNSMNNNWFFPSGNWENMADCIWHGHFEQKNTLCAWMEGWANFYTLAVNGDPCYDFNAASCGLGSTDMENHTWPIPPDTTPTGDQVEARVAGALLDIYDTTPDGFDQYSYGFDEIWDTFTHWGTVGNNQRYDSFRDFWTGWFDRGHYRHYANNSIYQSTIDYNMQPYISVPDYSMPFNTTRENAFHLSTYGGDLESESWRLTFALLDPGDPNCGVSLDTAGYIDIYPTPGWIGSCLVAVRATDPLGKHSSVDFFRVTVWEVTDILYLPLIMKGA